jgi:hypothetical protein
MAGGQLLMPKAIPMVCIVCRRTPGAYFGRLVFPQEEAVPECPNHEGSDLHYPLTPVNALSPRSLTK